MAVMLRPNVDMTSSAGGAGLTIGELAGHFGLAPHVLRHWESEGLLAPSRNAAGRRRYQRVDLFRVAAILLAKDAGLPLPEIQLIMTATDPAQRTDVLRRQRTALAERIAGMQDSLALIDGALGCRHSDIVTCPHFQAALAEHVDFPVRKQRTVSAGPGPTPRRTPH
jgi:MerR family transcriptional regulator, copper efflux regulator